MKKILLFVLAVSCFSHIGHAQWVKLFEGEHLKAWRPSESPETFKLTEGAQRIKVDREVARLNK